MATAYQWSGPGQEKFPTAGTDTEIGTGPPAVIAAPRFARVVEKQKAGDGGVLHGQEDRQFPVGTPVEPVKTRNLYKTVALGSVVAAFCMMYVYQHFRYIDLGLQLEDLKSKTQQARVLNSQLKLNIASLRDPRRIDLIARDKLGLTQPTANQIRDYASSDGSEFAEVRNPGPTRAR